MLIKIYFIFNDIIILGDFMLKYLKYFLLSMVPIIELRGSVPWAIASGVNPFLALFICIIGNILPVPFIYLFARKILEWGQDKKIIGKFFKFCLKKGNKAGKKLEKNTGIGIFIAIMLFVGIPVPGTGAWTGTLGASILNLKFKDTIIAVSLGVLLAGIIMAIFTLGLIKII